VDSHRLLIRPAPLNTSQREDYFGNEVAYFSVDQPHRQLTVTSSSQISIRDRRPVALRETRPWESIVQQIRCDRSEELLSAFQFTLDSPAIRRFAAAREFAQPAFPPGRSIGEALTALTTQIFSEFKFDSRATTIQTPVEEVLAKRHGVCQDFAHLQIACLRSLGLAARYVSGYLRTTPPPGKPRLVGADASHAWLSVYCGNAGWIDVDPTNNSLVGKDHITVAWGRDYHDVCPIQGVIVGGGEHRMHVAVDVEPLEG
jgi:transglutaminase-like putative cysteine protease